MLIKRKTYRDIRSAKLHFGPTVDILTKIGGGFVENIKMGKLWLVN